MQDYAGIADSVTGLPDFDKLRVYERFLYELTIVGRLTWFDDDLAIERKLNRLKWLKEINHRVLGRVRDLLGNQHACDDDELWATIRHHSLQPGGFEERVFGAACRAFSVVVHR